MWVTKGREKVRPSPICNFLLSVLQSGRSDAQEESKWLRSPKEIYLPYIIFWLF